MIKPIARTFAAAIALSPIGAGAAETATMGGGTAAPPEGSPGPGAGATAPPGQGAVRIPGTAVGRVPHPMQARRSVKTGTIASRPPATIRMAAGEPRVLWLGFARRA